MQHCTSVSPTLAVAGLSARLHLVPGCDVRSHGLSCFAGVIDAGCAHSLVLVGARKPRDLRAQVSGARLGALSPQPISTSG